MSGFMIVICIMLVMFAMLAIVLVRDQEATGAGPNAEDAADTNEVETLPVVDHNNLDINSVDPGVDPPTIESIGDESLVDAIPTAEETTAVGVAPKVLKESTDGEALDSALPADEAVIEPAETVAEELNQTDINVETTTDETTERESVDVNADNRQPEKADEI